MRLWLVALMAVVALLAPGVARAQATHAPSLEEKETARALFVKGDELFRTRQYGEALEAFVAADQIMGLPTTGLEVGRTQMLLRLHVEARDTLMRVTRLPVDPNEPDVQTEARAEALELANQVAGRIPTLKVEIRGVVDAVNVVVKLDGRPMAAAAIAHGVRVNPGIRRVRAQAAGYITRERNIDVAESQERIVTMTMRKLPAGAKSEVVVDEDDQRVLLGGATNHLTTLGWIGIGVGGAGVLVGTIFGVLTISKEASLADSCPASRCPASERGDIDEALAFAEVSTAGFVSGAVGLGLGVAALVLAPADSESSAALTLAPAGVVLEGTF